jgi:hypothetical protein
MYYRSLAARFVIAAALAVAIALGALAYLGDRPTHVVALGQPIRQDDFQYTVVGVTRSSALGTAADRTVANGVYYIVMIRVENDARGVAYRWDPSEVRVIDAAGRAYDYSATAQRALDANNPPPTVEHGTTALFRVVFDLPRGVADPQLAFSNGILMGDVFDAASYAKARIPLD